MEELKTIRKLFQHGLVCTVMNLKDTFLHVPMRHKVIVLLLQIISTEFVKFVNLKQYETNCETMSQGLMNYWN